jgi:acyl-CoA thioesterase-1
VVISLGGNDMLRGLPPAQTRKNIDELLTRLAQRKVPVLLMGMLAAPNWGAEQASAFNAIYPDLARKHGASLVPFFLQAVIDKPQLIQGDRIHPTAEGLEEMVAATVGEVAKALPPRPAAPPAPR